MDSFVKKQVIIRDNGNSNGLGASLIVEEPLEIRVNGTSYVVAMRTPGYDKELAAGLCFTEGIVNSLSEIKAVEFCADAKENAQNIINVTVEHVSGGVSGRGIDSRSSCGLCGVRMLDDIEKNTVPVVSDLRVRTEDLFVMMDRMSDQQKLSKMTRTAQAAGLFYSVDETVVVCEDVGRHNALDKVIGYALMNGIDCSRCVVTLSSRVSFEMVQKAVRAGIPIMAAVSAATSLSVNLAERMNCTLAGLVRDNNLVIYTHQERIIS